MCVVWLLRGAVGAVYPTRGVVSTWWWGPEGIVFGPHAALVIDRQGTLLERDGAHVYASARRRSLANPPYPGSHPATAPIRLAVGLSMATGNVPQTLGWHGGTEFQRA